MKHSILLSVALMIFVLTMSSCSEGPTDPTIHDQTNEFAAPPGDEEQKNTYIRNLWLASENATYAVATATINPVRGGELRAFYSSWGEEYEFIMTFPPGAISGKDPVEVSLHVPVNNGMKAPAVFKLEPDMQFRDEVTVELHYPQWFQHRWDYYSVFCMHRSGTVEPGTRPDFWYSDLMMIPMDPHQPRRIKFKTTHFSRWGVENGKMG
jgi:hypothetical protein